jgi:predicted nucleotidyltransferase component of viral defense system
VEIFTPTQLKVLELLADLEFSRDFVFTGGTALAALYLKHRYSDDLDFFTTSIPALGLVPESIRALAKKMGFECEFTRTQQTFVECFLENRQGEHIEMDFAVDAPFRFEPPVYDESLRWNVENKVDLACNKLSALFDRANAKDFVDIYFIDRTYLSFDKLVEKGKQKHIGLDNYWLAQACARVREEKKLPKMILPVTHDELVQFFEKKAIKLMEG